MKCILRDCFAYDEKKLNNCDCLTEVSKKVCPFYKSKLKWKAEIEEEKNRRNEKKKPKKG